MSERKYYVMCEDNCKFESMTKEQILTAIVQAVNEGTIGDIDTGFIQTVKTINGTPLKFFIGTQSEYELLSEEERENLFAVITNDTTKEALFEAIQKNEDDLNGLTDGLTDGTFKVKKATSADSAGSASTAGYASEAGSIPSYNTRITALETTVVSLSNALTALTKRVATLEENTGENVLTVMTTYSGGYALLDWNSISAATKYDVCICGDSSDDTAVYETTNTQFTLTASLYTAGKEVWVEAYDDADNLITSSQLFVPNKVSQTPSLYYYDGMENTAYIVPPIDSNYVYHWELYEEGALVDSGEVVVGYEEIITANAPGAVYAYARREGYIDSDTVSLDLAG